LSGCRKKNSFRRFDPAKGKEKSIFQDDDAGGVIVDMKMIVRSGMEDPFPNHQGIEIPQKNTEEC
jgi:hypothetical protein